jgi:DNA gyrase subunit A
MKATPRLARYPAINLVDETSELMVISQFGKIFRIDTKKIRARPSTQGVKLLDPRTPGQSSGRRSHPPEEGKTQPEEGTLLQ